MRALRSDYELEAPCLRHSSFNYHTWNRHLVLQQKERRYNFPSVKNQPTVTQTVGFSIPLGYAVFKHYGSNFCYNYKSVIVICSPFSVFMSTMSVTSLSTNATILFEISSLSPNIEPIFNPSFTNLKGTLILFSFPFC